jgi:predicted anti-sigma-YlaC factor YlaD
METQMPKCRDMTELSTDYFEHTLRWQTWLGVRWHLALCSMCRAYYDQLAKTLRLLHGRPLGEPDPATEARLVAARPTDEGTTP